MVLPTIAAYWYWLNMLPVGLKGDFASFIYYYSFIVLEMYNILYNMFIYYVTVGQVAQSV